MDECSPNLSTSLLRGSRLALHLFYAVLLAIFYQHLNRAKRRRTLKTWSRQLLDTLNIGIRTERSWPVRGEGGYRILSPDQAKKVGGYYSQTEFDLTRLLHLNDRMAEVGRSCVHWDYHGRGHHPTAGRPRPIHAATPPRIPDRLCPLLRNTKSGYGYRMKPECPGAYFSFSPRSYS